MGAEQGSRRAKMAAEPPTPADTRSFFDKLFGVQSSAGPALAYAAPESSPQNLAPGVKLSPAPSTAGPGTALYDISARIVYMPNGERLEAHSGLGDKIDDPRFVHVRMSGATYDKFLRAYLRGEVKRLVVVAGRGQDGPPGIFDRLIGRADLRDHNG